MKFTDAICIDSHVFDISRVRDSTLLQTNILSIHGLVVHGIIEVLDGHIFVVKYRVSIDAYNLGHAAL